MAARTLSRRALRDEHDASEAREADAPEADDDDADAEAEAPVKKPRARKAAAAKAPKGPKAPAKPRVRKKSVKVPPRMFARWAVCDNGMKRVAVFEYRDRVGADARLAELLDRKAGSHFLQLVKDPYDPPPAAV
jgi:hypothetical protein